MPKICCLELTRCLLLLLRSIAGRRPAPPVVFDFHPAVDYDDDNHDDYDQKDIKVSTGWSFRGISVKTFSHSYAHKNKHAKSHTVHTVFSKSIVLMPASMYTNFVLQNHHNNSLSMQYVWYSRELFAECTWILIEYSPPNIAGSVYSTNPPGSEAFESIVHFRIILCSWKNVVSHHMAAVCNR